jgi:phosphohistidine phosphatase
LTAAGKRSMSAKRLLILRHAKSDWHSGVEEDHDRPLAPRGLKAAASVGGWIARAGLVPRSVISSTAVRARTTAEIAAREGGWSTSVRLTRNLYEASPAAILGEIGGEPDDVDVLLIVGHEPSLSQLVSRLIGAAAIRLPTAALACVEPFSDRWPELSANGGQLLFLAPPRLLQKLAPDGV